MKSIPFEVLQLNIPDALYNLWRLPEDFGGKIRLWIENRRFRSDPPVEGNRNAMNAYGKPLVQGITGFDKKFRDCVDLVFEDGILTAVEFSPEGEPSQRKEYQNAFTAWYPRWEEEEKNRLQSHGRANRLHGEMRSEMTIDEKLDRRIAQLKPEELALRAWVFKEITGCAGYSKKVTVGYRNGGVRWTIPAMPPSANRRKIAKALGLILPEGEGQIDYHLNRGLLNPK